MTRHHIGRVSRRRAFVCVLGLAVSALSASPAFSSQRASDAQSDDPKVLREMVDAGKIQVVKQFSTGKAGLTGYVVKHGRYQTIVYSEDGYLMVGPLFGPNGRNLSKQYAAKYKPKPDVGKIVHALEPAHLVTQGAAKAPTLYAFVDPDCIYCHRFFDRVQPLIKTGKLRVHWILVGVLGPSSFGRAAAILGADYPLAALQQDEARLHVRTEQGGIAPASDPSAAITHVLAAHRQAMDAVGGTGTPTIVYTNPQGHWVAHVGVPPRAWLTQYADARSTP